MELADCRLFVQEWDDDRDETRPPRRGEGLYAGGHEVWPQ
jgi:hypothetical protein